MTKLLLFSKHIVTDKNPSKNLNLNCCKHTVVQKIVLMSRIYMSISQFAWNITIGVLAKSAGKQNC